MGAERPHAAVRGCGGGICGGAQRVEYTRRLPCGRVGGGAQRVEADGISAASGARTSVLSTACKAAGDIIQRAGSIWSAVCKVAGMCKKSLNNKDNLQKCPVLRF